MKNGRMKRLFCALLACMLLFSGAALAEQTQTGGESGTIEVLLKSLGEVFALDITLSGSYTLNGDADFRLNENAELRVSAVGDEVWVACGGINMNMGGEAVLARHQKDGANGLYIEGSPRGKLYCGSLRLTASDGVLTPVLLIDIEEYLYGVVPYEMNDAFPIEALKAQAVAARTYALKRRADREGMAYDVVDTTADQVFFGYDPVCVNAIAAVDATRGIAGLYKGSYATCYYTASNGGQTAMARDILGVTSDDGYLAVSEDPYDLENPKSMVTSLTIRADGADLPAALEKMLKASAAERLSAMNYSDEEANITIDRIVSVEAHTPMNGSSNRMYRYLTVKFRVKACPMVGVYSTPTAIDWIHALFGRNTYEPTLLGEKAGDPVALEEEFSCEISVYDQLKHELGMKISSIDCELTTVRRQQGAASEEFVIEMRRYGHGVGMSQRGAQWMAGQYGKRYTEILSFYYPGLTFEAMSFAAETLPALTRLPEGVAVGSEGSAVRQKELPALRSGERYAKVELATAWSTLNVREAASTDARILSVLQNEWRVIVMSEANGWAHVRTADVEGYVSSQYLVME